MARESNFLLGQGERLTDGVKVPSGGGRKNAPYSFQTARTRISERLQVVNRDIISIPDVACPDDKVVAILTMHPRYISKSDFPADLLQIVGLEAVGSRSRKITPESWGIDKPPELAVAEDIFVSGRKSDFAKWGSQILNWTENDSGAEVLTHIEDFSSFKPEEKLRSIPRDRDEAILEIVLHSDGNPRILEAFVKYAASLDSEALIERQRTVRGLTFIPVNATIARVNELANFSLLRVARGMPQLRPFRPNITRNLLGFDVTLPDLDALDLTTKAVIFDGGLPSSIDLSRWVNLIEPVGIGAPDLMSQEHGLAVTSAFLFGPLTIHRPMPQPICKVDHVRVLDNSKPVDWMYLDVLDRILQHLDDNKGVYKFVNLSLGPNLAVDDDEVTSWTAALDERFAQGHIVATVAVGNDGELDDIAGLNRVQPPADGVNVLAVGASDSISGDWGRALYSCIGPGRSPGLVKPDGVAFGGSDKEAFSVLSATRPNRAEGTTGTSFAAPFALRSAVAVRSQLGLAIEPLTIKALMIHRAVDKRNDLVPHHRKDVGWGQFETDSRMLITCDDDEALVIYQGQLLVGQHLRAPIPLPDSGLLGKVVITATLVIAPDVDPQHPGAYTRAGLEVAFRPNSINFKKKPDGTSPTHAATKPFFSASNIAPEYVLRDDGIKWEPCLRHSQTFLAKTLHQPVFDIYYHHRESALPMSKPQPIPYGLVVSVKAKDVPDLYNKIVRTYAGVLIPLQPKLRIPVST